MYALEARNISKTYQVYSHPWDRFREILLRKPQYQAQVSLHPMTLSLPHGNILGIIGNNGAGKSTLLKILTGTVQSSTGEVIRGGRLAALLELGAGFHPDLTGRDNIYINGMVLGLTEAEIQEREAEIIEFSELEKFIDRPVKTYSSGMYMRLAFAVATSIDPDILIIDEALSVGDQHFQKKCIDRMMRFKEEGRTILFCSHSMYLVKELCNQTIWLHEGKIQQQGETKKVVDAYEDWCRRSDELPDAKDSDKAALLEATDSDAETSIDSLNLSPAQEQSVWLDKIEVVNSAGDCVEEFNHGDMLALRITIGMAKQGQHKGSAGALIQRVSDQVEVFGTTTLWDKLEPIDFKSGMQVEIQFPKCALLAGKYRFMAVLVDEYGVHLYHLDYSSHFQVHAEGKEMGIIRMEHEWKIS